jgi:hypothetical protein
MTIQFPQRRPDGSFDVLLRIQGVPSGTHVESWTSEWAEKNSSWERVWDGADRRVEVLRMLDDFFAPPSIQGGATDEANVLLRVRPDSTMWKDWMAKFVEELIDAHPGATLVKLESVEPSQTP